AGAAVDVDPLAHRPQDLLMPYGGHPLEVAVDDPDGAGAFEPNPVDVALGDRRHADGIQLPADGLAGDRGAAEDIDRHGLSYCAAKIGRMRRRFLARSASARAPGTYSVGVISGRTPSRPGTTTFTTGTPN